MVWSGLCSNPSCPLGACRRLWGSTLQVCAAPLNHVSFFSSQSCLLLATKLPFSFLFSYFHLVSALTCHLTLLILFHVCDEPWAPVYKYLSLDQETMSLLRRHQFPSLFINQFFPRPGTPAARMKRVPTHLVKQRTKQLSDYFHSYYPYQDRLGKVYRWASAA